MSSIHQQQSGSGDGQAPGESADAGATPSRVSVTPRIEQSARAQLKMVNDLLDFGRIGTGKLRIAPRPVKLSALASMAVEAARPAAEAKGLTLAIEPGPGGNVVGDPDRLLQVIA